MEQLLGRVEAVNGASITVGLAANAADDAEIIRIGSLVTVEVAHGRVIATVNAVEWQEGPSPRRSLIADLLGELSPENRFARGVAHFPIPGAAVHAASESDLDAVYARPAAVNVRIGTLHHDPKRAAFLLTDELLAKHFAVLGTTGSGKSCAVTLILRAVLSEHKNAHVILLDPHNEYESAFAEQAEIVNIDNLQLPFWLLDYEEAVATLVKGGTAEEQQSQATILKDAITYARRKFAGNLSAQWITVDTPVPYRIGDLVHILDESMGRLDKPDSSAPYLRLKTRIESLNADRRFSFMFSRVVTRDILGTVIGRILRIPVDGRPVTIMDLSGVPSEIVNVVVSLLCRITFDFALWADRERMPPILLVCEEAHRYVPADERVGFSSTTRAISRIAKEGRKYGVSLGLVTQRPSELAVSALTQCGTLFALRMGNDLDQSFVANSLPEAAHGMVGALPSMRPQEAIVVGEGVPLPMRVRFDELPPEHRPRSRSAEFSKAWQEDGAGADFLEDSVMRWRMQMRKQTGPA
ncbi:MAG TPA: ATP-binding protein [Stellaceae bacterium]|nr:ATP-binding protein [Stellaceae bacterium]